MNAHYCICKFKFLIFILYPVFAAIGQNDTLLEIYVDADGNRRADGSIARPYSTLPGAVNAVRALRKSGNTDPAIIYLREGRHQLNETLVLGIEDRNTLRRLGLKLRGTTQAPALLVSRCVRISLIVGAGLPRDRACLDRMEKIIAG
jgi:hypothetical protein